MNDEVKAACIGKIKNLFRETEDEAARRKRARQEGQKHKAVTTGGDHSRKEIGLWEVNHALRHKSGKLDETEAAVEFRPSLAWLSANGFAVSARRLQYTHPKYCIDRIFIGFSEVIPDSKPVGSRQESTKTEKSISTQLRQNLSPQKFKERLLHLAKLNGMSSTEVQKLLIDPNPSLSQSEK